MQNIKLDDATGVIERAGNTVLEQGLTGALLLLSLAGNVALIVALIRCWRSHSFYGKAGQDGQF